MRIGTTDGGMRAKLVRYVTTLGMPTQKAMNIACRRHHYFRVKEARGLGGDLIAWCASCCILLSSRNGLTVCERMTISRSCIHVSKLASRELFACFEQKPRLWQYVIPPSRCRVNQRALGSVYRRAYCSIQPPTSSNTTWKAVKESSYASRW